MTSLWELLIFMHGLHHHFSPTNLTLLSFYRQARCMTINLLMHTYRATVIVDATAVAVREKHRFTSLIHAIKYFMWSLFMFLWQWCAMWAMIEEEKNYFKIFLTNFLPLNKILCCWDFFTLLARVTFEIKSGIFLPHFHSIFIPLQIAIDHLLPSHCLPHWLTFSFILFLSPHACCSLSFRSFCQTTMKEKLMYITWIIFFFLFGKMKNNAGAKKREWKNKKNKMKVM